jgi:NAD(P)-dependent dehydrogenase (short-subunit alcohol dehydrogenase family)
LLRNVFLLLIAATGTYYGIDRVVAYAASTSAVEGMVKVLASEFSAQGVRVNTIAPGFIETEMSRMTMNSDPNRRGHALRRIPMGKFGQLSGIGHAAVFLTSEAARYVTGVPLPVDGDNSIDF